MKKLLRTNAYPFLLCRLVTGLTFVSEGIQKFIRPDEVGAGRFARIGFADASFWAQFAGSFEIVCGLPLLAGFVTRLAAIPLLVVMTTAFITTKLPILTSGGFWAFAHDYRTDFAMTLLLILLITYGGGRNSMDARITQKKP